MRVYVLCIYWTLLLISVVSSGFLFLLVALEGAQADDPSFHAEKNETYNEAYNNITLNYDNQSFKSSIFSSETQAAVTFKTAQNDQQERAASASFETNNDVEKKNADVLTESLQQPNLSQGISDTGQAVVLTLVDAAAAELQNLVEPKVDREFSSGSSIKNSSLLSDQTRQSEHTTAPTTEVPSSSIVDETTEQPNDTDVSENEKEALLLKKISEEAPEVVVIVRAEQVNVDELDIKVEENVEQVSEELPTKIDDVFATAPELNDTAARAQLIGGTRDESGAVILDGFVTTGSTDTHEDIPSFSEWAQKRLEEAEKKKPHPNISVQTPGGPGRGVNSIRKIRSKNYASPDCGAKVVASNPEASSAKNILVSTRDEYMLNTCSSRIWFVVELCEAIQAKKIELANFELFSSSPKDFSVYVSDRYPTKDWSPVGQFTAKDIKDTQSFALHPHLFGKFIKVELQSYYGSEHFCPISLFRAYGTSEFEVLETETEYQILQEISTENDYEDSDEEDLLDSEGDSLPTNLFGSACDAVLSIMKKAAEVLSKSSDFTGNTEPQDINNNSILHNTSSYTLCNSYTSCMTPKYIILCDNCTDQQFANVFQLVSCRDYLLDNLLKIDLVNKTLRRQETCNLHGVAVELFWPEVKEKRNDTTNFNLLENLQTTFLVSVFKSEYIIALCNVLAIKERKMVMNTSYEISVNSSKDAILSIRDTDHNGEINSHQSSATLDSNSFADKSIPSSREIQQQIKINEEIKNVNVTFIQTSAPSRSTSSTESLASQIKPTKKLNKEDVKEESSIPILDSSKEFMEETLQVKALTTDSPSNPTPTLKIEPPIQATPVEITSHAILSMNLDTQEVSDTFVSIESVEDTEANVQIQMNKSENSESDGKEKLRDLGEQEVRLSQDHIAFDTLFPDLKDLESEAANMQNGASSSSSMPLPTASTTPQKESVFLRLSNRIKILERNMSLSGQYLEELSRRYKKQVEEMQRSLERAVAAMSEESRKGEEREAKRVEEITALREKISVLSKSFETLLYDQDSWHSCFSTIIQHILLVCFEVVLIILILSYCRKTEEAFEEKKEKDKRIRPDKKKQDSTIQTSSFFKKGKKRRPSENENNTSDELTITDNHQIYEVKKEHKKKRKKDTMNKTLTMDKMAVNDIKEAIHYNIISGNTIIPWRRASSIDPTGSDLQESQDSLDKRPESAPETTVDWFDGLTERTQQPDNKRTLEMKPEQSFDQIIKFNNKSLFSIMDRSSEGSAMTEEKNASCKSSIFKGAKLNPLFMKTVIVPSNRKASVNLNSSEKWRWNLNSEHLSDKSPFSFTNLDTQIGDNPTNALTEENDESRSCRGVISTLDKKRKKGTGLKKMSTVS